MADACLRYVMLLILVNITPNQLKTQMFTHKMVIVKVAPTTSIFLGSGYFYGTVITILIWLFLRQSRVAMVITWYFSSLYCAPPPAVGSSTQAS